MTITGGARLAGVLGWPVSHSRSPQLHGHWLQRYALDGAYLPLAVDPGDLAAVVRALPRTGFRGFNVTTPHKEAMIPLLDEVDDLARRVGAVNTVICGPNGRLVGTNTDVFGFLENLRAGAPEPSLEHAATIIGAGGAARAVVIALADAGVPEIRLVNRTREKAEAVAADLGAPITIVSWPERNQALAGAGLVVNTTTLGMAGNPPLELDVSALRDDAVATDIVYTPLETPFLKASSARGLRTVDGLGMLLHQARPGFHAWFGVDPVVDTALREAVLRDAAL